MKNEILHLPDLQLLEYLQFLLLNCICIYTIKPNNFTLLY